MTSFAGENTMADTNYDVIIIGSGPGGYVTAIRSAQLGLKTAIVEREHMGGICLNWGCIPTKALLRSAEIYHFMQHAKDYGLSADNISFDPAAVVKRSRGVSGQLNGGISFLMKKNKVDIIWGEGKVSKVGEVTVSKTAKKAMEPQHSAPKGTKGEGVYKAKHIIVATGARPRVIPGIEPDGKDIWTYFEAMVPPSMPKSLIVMGSGAIGIEFASFYRTMGAEVTVIEMMPNIMPVEDPEISAMAKKSMEKQGFKFLMDAKVSAVKKGPGGVTATVETKDGKKQDLTAEKMISAVGVVGNIENLGLEGLGVKTDRGCVVIDGYGRTNVPGVYAIGDVAGPPMLAHKAEHEGVICVEKIAGKDVHPMDKSMIPGCTYCNPQVASVGLTEPKAKEAGYDIKVGRFPFIGNGKAIALGEPDGMVKTIFDAKTGQLLGAHMVGAEVTELIQGYVVAMNLETTEEDLMHTVFPHPTLSEMMKESVLDAYGRALNM
jgi:dihydrolipoyl dehydrogenase